MKEEKIFYKIIDDICREKEIKQTLLSYGWIRELSKNNKIRHIIGYQFDINSASSYKIVSDKFATYEVLHTNGIPTIPHKMIFNSKTRSLYYNDEFIEEALKILRANKKIVVKANDSYKGKDVYLCSNENQVRNIVKKLFEENNDTLSACPYIDIDFEYRVICLNGKVSYVYKKKKPYITGDGVHTIKELIYDKFIKNNIKPSLFLELELEKIPKKSEEITISWKHNLSSGAEVILVSDNEENIERIKNIALLSAKAVNINFASVDVSLTSDKKIQVMEINGNVCMNKFIDLVPNGYEIAKRIYKEAIELMF